LGGGQDVVGQAQRQQVPHPKALAKLLGQSLRPQRLGPQGFRQGKTAQPEFAGGNGLGVLLVRQPALRSGFFKSVCNDSQE